MLNMNIQIKNILFFIFLCANTLWTQGMAQSFDFKSTLKVDGLGFIDVWLLRSDVAKVEALTVSNNTEACIIEGDPEGTLPTPEHVRQDIIDEEACTKEILEAYEKYQKVYRSFNEAWLPVMYGAIRRRDLVAEVIMRQCDATSAFDRTKIESTCDSDTEKKAIAMSRLKEIGFAPAYQNPKAPGKKVYGTRAFTFHRSNEAAWKTDSFAYLRLNRTPMTPGYLTWGSELYYGGSRDFYTGLDNFDFPWNGAFIEKENEEIEHYLKEDARWAVFLIHRIGYHEWVPERMKSTTHLLDPSWEGDWELKKYANNWSLPMEPAKGSATIKRDGEFMKISIDAEITRHPLKNVVNCRLRYSGGLTYLPELSPEGQSSRRTMLGYFYKAGASRMPRSAFRKAGVFVKDGENKQAVEPFGPNNRYKQVLMQCLNAESDKSGRMRFLLLANDVLVEFGGLGDQLAVRH